MLYIIYTYIYRSVGMLAYQLLTGRFPFWEDVRNETLSDVWKVRQGVGAVAAATRVLPGGVCRLGAAS
jgi:hypothetical protein